MMLSAGSCQREIVHLEGDTQVTFEVSTGEIATKAIADASNITVLHWELYGSDIRTAKAPYGEGTVTETDGDKKFTVNLRLVADQDYNIVFWAETEHGATHYETSDLRNVKIKTYGDENANDESRAAFFGTHNFQTENGVSVNEQVTLYRPFAQINLGTTTYDTSLNMVNGGKVAVNSTEMTVNSIANTFNTLDGVGKAVDFNGEVTFKAAATPNGEADKTQKLLKVNEDTYFWTGMNYLIVEGDSDAIDVDVVLNTNMGKVEHSIDNVPVKENYRTNILGDFLTTGATFNIIVDPAFEAPDHIIGEDWTQTGDFKYTVNAGAQAGTLKAILEHAHSEAVRGGLKDVVVTVELKGDVDWETGASHGSTPLIAEGSPIVAVIINGNNKTFTATGAGVGPIRMANGGKLTFNNVKIVDQSVSYNEGAWELGYLEMGGNLELNNCQVVNAIMVSDNFAANGTSFNSHKDSEYAVWVDGGKASFTGSTFAGPRGLKIHEAYGSEVAEVLVDACTFDHISKKPGIAMGDLNAETTVIVKNSLFDRCQAGDQGLYMYETDTDVTTFTFIRENNIVISADEPVVQEDGSILVACAAALQKALDNAAKGTTTIKIAGDIVGDVIVKQTEDKNIVIDGMEYNYDGTIYIWGNARYEGAETLDIKNVNFKHADGAIDFISSNTTASAERYAHNVTIEGCSFEGGANAVAAKFRQAYDIVIKNSKVIAGHSLAQLNGCAGVAIEGVDVKAGRGVSFGTSTGCTVSGSSFEAVSYGLRADGTSDGSLSVSNTSIKADQPIIVRNMTGEYAVAVEGVVLTTAEPYQVVFTNGADDAEYVVPTGKYTLDGGEGLSVFPVVDTKKLYKVTTPEELLKYAYMVQKVDPTLQLEIMNDITLPQYEIAADDAKQTYVYTTTPITVSAGVPSGNNWMPLGTASVMFEGTIEGHRNTIKGLRIKSDSDLLGFVAAAMTAGTSIKNLNFEDAVVSGTAYVGTVAGYVRDGVQITNCHVRNVSVNGTSDNVGALVGQHYTRYKGIEGIEGGKLPKTVMENCTADAASKVKGHDNVGGIAGLNYGGVMINCRNAATVEGQQHVGGVAGYTREYHHYKSGYVIACGNEGKVSGNSNVGSIVGTSLKDNNHQSSVSAVVACWSTAEEGSYPYLLVSNCVNAMNYGSWGIKTQSSQSAIRYGQNTACYAFDSAASITQAQVDAMNAAIDAFNDVADFECPYKWSWTAGSLPVLN